jgi:hypothetical protein
MSRKAKLKNLENVTQFHAFHLTFEILNSPLGNMLCCIYDGELNNFSVRVKSECEAL